MKQMLRDLLADFSERLMCDGVPHEFTVEPALSQDDQVASQESGTKPYVKNEPSVGG